MRQDWFSTPIWSFQYENHQALNKSLLNNILREKDLDVQGMSISNVMGWHSKDDLHQRNEYKEFAVIASNLALEVATEQKWDLTLVSPTINNCWAMVNETDSFNVLHHHPNSMLSGVYYAQVPENSGNIYFYDPRSGAQMLLPPFQQMTSMTIGKISYKPIEGMFLIFPSWLWHGVEPNCSDKSRICLSFNIGTAIKKVTTLKN